MAAGAHRARHRRDTAPTARAAAQVQIGRAAMTVKKGKTGAMVRVVQVAGKRRQPGQPRPAPVLADLSSGEILEGITVFVPRRLPSPYTDGWMQTAQGPLMEIATDKDYTLTAYRVLTFLNAILDYENYINTPPSIIADCLRLHRPCVSKTLKFLIDKGVLFEGPRVGQSPTYRLNPEYGWKGNIKLLRDNLSPDRSRPRLQKRSPHKTDT
jgi:hypothetical protein